MLVKQMSGTRGEYNLDGRVALTFSLNRYVLKKTQVLHTPSEEKYI